MTPSMLVAKAKLVQENRLKPDMTTTDDMLSKLVELHRTNDVAFGEVVADLIDVMLDHRRELSLTAQAERLSWGTTTSL